MIYSLYFKMFPVVSLVRAHDVPWKHPGCTSEATNMNYFSSKSENISLLFHFNAQKSVMSFKASKNSWNVSYFLQLKMDSSKGAEREKASSHDGWWWWWWWCGAKSLNNPQRRWEIQVFIASLFVRQIPATHIFLLVGSRTLSDASRTCSVQRA